MYLSNGDRIRLALQSYGSDVPDEVVADAEAALATATGSDQATKAKAPSAKVRARTKKGEFQPDDPLTTEVDEAWADSSPIGG